MGTVYNYKIRTNFLCLFLLLRAAPVAYRSSQARGRIGAAAANFATATARQDLTQVCDLHTHILDCKAEYLTHWAKTGMEPTTSWILFPCIPHWPTMGTSWKEILHCYKMREGLKERSCLWQHWNYGKSINFGFRRMEMWILALSLLVGGLLNFFEIHCLSWVEWG